LGGDLGVIYRVIWGEIWWGIWGGDLGVIWGQF
jgi:hypothetical protein